MTGETEGLLSTEEAAFLKKSARSGTEGKLGDLPVAKLDDARGPAAGLDESQMSALKATAGRLAEGLTAALTAVLGDQTTARRSGLRFGSLDEFRSSLPMSAERVLRGPGPEQWAVPAVPLPLAEEILDHMLGAGDATGTGAAQGAAEGGGQAEPRKLTRVDECLLDELFSLVCREWAGILPGGGALEVVEASGEGPPRPAELGGRDSDNVIADFDVEGRAFGGLVRMICPVSLLIGSREATKGSKREDEASGRRLSADRLSHVPVGLSVRVGNVALLSTDLVALRPGMIVPLNTPPDGPVRVMLAGKTQFEGRLARNGDRVVLEIVAPADTQGR